MKENIEVKGLYLNIQPPHAALFISGLLFDADTLDIGCLLKTLRSALEGLHHLSNFFYIFS